MRTIGKKNIEKVKQTTQDLLETCKVVGQERILRAVRDMLPAELWDTWEMADQEINRIILDTIFEFAYGRRN